MGEKQYFSNSRTTASYMEIYLLEFLKEHLIGASEEVYNYGSVKKGCHIGSFFFQ